jgi:lauroyl/myristoyl acyltransferase
LAISLFLYCLAALFTAARSRLRLLPWRSRREVDRLVAHVASYIVEPASRQVNARLWFCFAWLAMRRSDALDLFPVEALAHTRD